MSGIDSIQRRVYRGTVRARTKAAYSVDYEARLPEASRPARGARAFRVNFVDKGRAPFVYQGDDVELQIWGVNGKEHPGRIEGYDKAFGVQRGQLTTVSFKADKAGVFRILCDIHNPSMTGTLVVLGR